MIKAPLSLIKAIHRHLQPPYRLQNATLKSVSWSTSDNSVATVSSTGEVTAVGGGTATITAMSDDNNTVKAQCTITVNVPVTGISLDESAIVTYIGKSTTLTATIAPADATDKSITWTSDDTGVATVTGGVVTGVSEGTTVIRATANDGGFEATCNVTVGAAPTDAIYSSVYTIDQTESLLRGVADEITLSAMISHLEQLRFRYSDTRQLGRRDHRPLEVCGYGHERTACDQ